MSHYDTLGLNTNATKEEIAKKYNQLVKKWHPDKCSDKMTAQNKLIEINKAYKILNNEKERKKYDKSDIFLQNSKKLDYSFKYNSSDSSDSSNQSESNESYGSDGSDDFSVCGNYNNHYYNLFYYFNDKLSSSCDSNDITSSDDSYCTDDSDSSMDIIKFKKTYNELQKEMKQNKIYHKKNKNKCF